MIEGAIIGAIAGGFIGLLLVVLRLSKFKKVFNIQKGMTYGEVVNILGEPNRIKEKPHKKICFWQKTVEGKQMKVKILFKDDICRSIIVF